MPIFFGYCPHCDALKAVEVEVEHQYQGDGLWTEIITTVSGERLADYDDCVCVLTPEEERTVIASAEDNAINAEPDYPDPD